MKKICMVVTNTAKYEGHKRLTGLWLGEAAEFYQVLTQAGYEIDVISPLGGYVSIDPHSFKYMSEVDWACYQDVTFQNKVLSQTLTPQEVRAEDYEAIYYTGGHGVMWDFPKNPDLQKLAESIYAQGGYVTSVCHGVVGLLNLQNSAGEFLIKDRQITGFTNTEEKLNRTAAKVPFMTEDELKKRGCRFDKKLAFTEHALVDGRIITGQNPQSPKKVAQLLVEELQKKSVGDSKMTV